MAAGMTRRTFVASSAAAAAAIYLGACGGTSSAPGRRTLRLAGGGFGFPSPFAYIAGPGYIQMSYLYDTLVWKDASGRIIPWLATRFARSRDGLTYTFELRSGVTWHDGRPLTAEDVAECVAFCVRLPQHVNIDRLVVKPVAQAAQPVLHRGPIDWGDEGA